MGLLIQYVSNYAPWIYAACAIAALYQIYRIWHVRAERRQAVFTLERERAVRDIYNIFGIAMLLLLTMGLTYFTSTVLASAVAPLVQESQNPSPPLPFVPTPTNTPISATPTPTVTPVALAVTPQPEPETPTPAPDLSPSPSPTPAPRPAVVAAACPDGRSLLTSPGQNQTVSGFINIMGTASHENFQYYKIEYSADGGAYTYLAGGNAPVINGVLGSVDTAALGNGTWTLRLIVVDQTGNYPPPCQVTFSVQN